MERYSLWSTTGINIRPTASQYLHLQTIYLNYIDIDYADNTTPYLSGNKINTAVASI